MDLFAGDAGIGLVDDQQDGFVETPEVLGHLFVGGGQTFLAVDHQQQQVAFFDGEENLGRKTEGIVAGHEAAGIDDLDGKTFGELAATDQAIAGDAGQVVDDGLAAADEAVEEGGFADVGSADDGQSRDLAGDTSRAGPRRFGASEKFTVVHRVSASSR